MTTPPIALPDFSTSSRFPLFLERVSAGFPSPADDYMEDRLDLNHYLVKHPAATFFVRASGDSMRPDEFDSTRRGPCMKGAPTCRRTHVGDPAGAGIHPGDILVVDRSLEPLNKSVVIAVINGELTVKRLVKSGGKLLLVPDNENYQPIEIRDGMDFEVWGVVTAVIHTL